MQLDHFAQPLADYSHLLPTQHDLLQRVLFQLTFNDLNRFAIVGTTGSGKTTLSLVLAEVLSTEHNVALISSVMQRTELEHQLLSQWLGANQANHIGFDKALHHLTSAGQPLVLLVDNFQQFAEAEQQWLLGLSVSLCCFCETPLAGAQLNLTINPLTLADAEQLLQQEQLDQLTLAGRLAAAQGNIRLLLDPPTASVQGATATLPLPWQYLLPGLALVLLLIASSWFWLQTDNDMLSAVPVVPAVSNQNPAMLQEPEALQQQTPELDLQPEIVLPDITDDLVEPVDVEQQAEPRSEQSAGSELHSSDIIEQQPVAQDSATQGDEPAAVSVPTDSTDTTEPINKAPREPDWPADEAMLLAAPASMVALQFAVLSDMAAVERFAQQYPELKFYRYQRSWQGRLQWVLLSELQADNAAALRLIATLPVRLQAAGPFAKSLRPVQQEIKALQRSQEQQGQQHD